MAELQDVVDSVVAQRAQEISSADKKPAKTSFSPSQYSISANASITQSGGGNRSRGAATWAGQEVLLMSEKLLDCILCSLPSMHLLLGLAPTCAAWSRAARRAESKLGTLDCSPYPLMNNAELLFLMRRFRRSLTDLRLTGCKVCVCALRGRWVGGPVRE